MFNCDFKIFDDLFGAMTTQMEAIVMQIAVINRTVAENEVRVIVCEVDASLICERCKASIGDIHFVLGVILVCYWGNAGYCH
jgi:hypothetical protein